MKATVTSGVEKKMEKSLSKSRCGNLQEWRCRRVSYLCCQEVDGYLTFVVAIKRQLKLVLVRAIADWDKLDRLFSHAGVIFDCDALFDAACRSVLLSVPPLNRQTVPIHFTLHFESRHMAAPAAIQTLVTYRSCVAHYA